MSFQEQPFTFDCGGEQLVGVLAQPDVPARIGVVVIVGGPQYRAGSHRQFVLLSRALARRGIACLRFDYRGMGDSAGAQRGFDTVDEDVRAAIDAFISRSPQTESIVLWGLCDGASAACFYAPRDRRVAGLVLLNPWVRTEAGQARTYLKHYYLQRVFSRSFWKKLLSGGVALGKAATSLGNSLRTVGRGSTSVEGGGQTLPMRMAACLRQAAVPLLVILSGKDYVAREFQDLAGADPAWTGLLAAGTVERLENADHTFSTAAWRDEVAELTENWLVRLGGVHPSSRDEKPRVPPSL